jgi:hypothetical protein
VAALLCGFALLGLLLLVAWSRRPVAIRARSLGLFVLIGAAVVSWSGLVAIGSVRSALSFGLALAFALIANFRKRDVLLLFSPKPGVAVRTILRRLLIDYEERDMEWRLTKYGGRVRVFVIFPHCYWVSVSAERITPKIELLTTLMRKFLANPDTISNSDP